MPTLSNFIQLFHFSNWEKIVTVGSITSNDPYSVVLKSSITNNVNSTSMSIKIPINGTITFTYAASSSGFLSISPFGYGLNANYVSITNSSTISETGTRTVNITGGDTFAFFTTQNATSNLQETTTTITNFSFTYAYPICYNEGTKILCLNPSTLLEEYIEIEKLRKGDTVKSYKHGYRKIDLIGKKKMINNPLIFMDCMYKLEKTPENGLVEDLMLTGGHSILVDDFKDKNINATTLGQCERIDDKYLVRVGTIQEFVKQENNDEYTYYHFILENDNDDSQRFGVWANGMLTDTPSKTEFIDHNYELLH